MKSWLLPRRASVVRTLRKLPAAAAVGLGLLIPGLAPADEPPRYALRHVYGEKPGPRLLVIALPQATWEDLRKGWTPHLESLMQRGAVGLMPAAASSDPDPGRTWVTLGAGRAAVSGNGEVGWRGGEGGEAQLSVADLYVANHAAHTSARPGLLGSRLRASGLRTGVVVYGNVDEDHAPLGLVTLMDEEGRVDRLRVAPACHPEGAADAVAAAMREALAECDVVLLQIQPHIAAVAYGMPPREVAQSPWHIGLADDMVGECLDLIEGMEALVLVVSPVSPGSSHRGERRLAPMLMYEAGDRSGPGVLTSASTRWEGMIAPSDFAPTVLSWWQVADGPVYAGMSGRAMRSAHSDQAIARVTRLDEALTYRHQLQITAATSYVVYGAVLLAVALAIALAAPQKLSALRGAGLGLALAPIGLLLSPLCGLRIVWVEVLVAAAITTALGLACCHIRPARRALAVALLGGAALIVADALGGSHLMRKSALGFGVMAGSRFYGLGNEYLGVLIGMSAVGLGALVDLSARGRRLAGALGALVVLCVGAPFAGANWGGSFAAAAGLLAVWLAGARGRRAAFVPAAIALLAASVAMPAALDLLKPAADRSHIGLTFTSLLAGHSSTIGDTITRKLAMNKGILLYSPLNALIALAAAALLWLLLRRGGPLQQALSGASGLRAGLIGALIAAAAAGLVNDSGLVAAGGAVAVTIGSCLFLSAKTVEMTA